MYKVMVIAYYFPPMGLSGVQRTLKFVKYMSEFNWEPTVLTTGKTGYYAYDESLMKEADDAGIRIVRTKAKDPNSMLSKFGQIKMPSELIRKTFSILSKTFFIPDNKISWSKKVFKTASELLENERFDLVFVTIPPFSAFKTAIRIKEKFNIPVIVDYRDLWVGNMFEFLPTPYHRYAHRKLEESLLRNVDKVIAVNRKVKENLIKRYEFLGFDDVQIIPHGFDPADFNLRNKNILDKSKFNITFTGIFYESWSPKFFLQAFKEIVDQNPEIASNIRLNFAGYLRKENEVLIQKLQISEYVNYFGYLKHKDSVNLLMNSDILWLMLSAKIKMDAVTPGKFFEYIGTKKPIIACVPEGAAKDAANEYGASIIVHPEKTGEIKTAILELYDLWQKNSLPMADEDFVEKHNRRMLTEILTKQFQFLVQVQE